MVIFKAIVLCALYNLSDDQVEYQIRDRFSFTRFLGLGLENKVPDAKAVWHYRDQLVRRYKVTDAAVHDSQVVEDILDPNNTASDVWADSAYRLAEIEAKLDEMGLKSRIHRKSHRNKPLTKRVLLPCISCLVIQRIKASMFAKK